MQEVSEACGVEMLPAVADWCSTGASVLDLAISNQIPGGVPVGRIVQVYGGASTAKSVLGTTILGYALRSGKQAFLADIEHTLDPKFASMYGLDCSQPDFFYGYSYRKNGANIDQPATLEEFFDEYLAGILNMPTRRPKIVVVDSITALPAEFEVTTAMNKQGFGAYRAKQIGLGLRKYLSLLAKKNVTLFCVDQTRDAVGSPFSGEVTTGGRGLEFYSSVRLYLKHDKKVTNSFNQEIGIWVKYQVAKNKVAPPYRKGHFKILFDYGLDDITSSLSYLASTQGASKEQLYNLTTKVYIPICEKCGALLDVTDEKCTMKGCDGNVISEADNSVCNHRIMDWVPRIEDEGREEQLKRVVSLVWARQHETENRKARTW